MKVNKKKIILYFENQLIPEFSQEEVRRTKKIPDEFRDLIDSAIYVAFTTMMSKCYPQTTLIWCNSDGENILVNAMKGFQKERNMRRNPKVNIFAWDRKNPLRLV